MRRVSDEQRCGVVVEHRQDEPEDLPIRLLSGRAHHELAREVLERPQLDLPCLRRRGPLDRPPEKDRDEHGQPEEHEEHDDVLRLPDDEGVVGREEEEVEDDEAEDRGEDPRPDPADPRGRDHHDEEPESLGQWVEVVPEREESRDEEDGPQDTDRVRERLLARSRGPHQPEHVARRPIVLLAHRPASVPERPRQASHLKDVEGRREVVPHGSRTWTHGFFTGP